MQTWHKAALLVVGAIGGGVVLNKLINRELGVQRESFLDGVNTLPRYVVVTSHTGRRGDTVLGRHFNTLKEAREFMRKELRRLGQDFSDRGGTIKITDLKKLGVWP